MLPYPECCDVKKEEITFCPQCQVSVIRGIDKSSKGDNPVLDLLQSPKEEFAPAGGL